LVELKSLGGSINRDETIMNNWHPDIFAKAWNFATFYHKGQTFGGPKEGMQIEYINHVASVSIEIIWVLPSVPDVEGNLTVQCALLHDVIEDTEATYELVLEHFDVDVANGVLALTKDLALPTKAEQMEDSLKRIQEQRKEIWMVKMADRITNLYHPPFYWDNDRIEAYRQESIKIYEALHPANEMLAKRLHDKIERYEGFLRYDSVGRKIDCSRKS
jgi:(p)ppGpp synthase/HD superfamily hydrolase